MVLSILGAAVVAVIAGTIIIRNKPTVEYFEGIQPVYTPGAGYLYRFYLNGEEHHDGFYPTANAAIIAGWEHHKKLTLTKDRA